MTSQSEIYGREFDSYCPCHKKVRNYVGCGLFSFWNYKHKNKFVYHLCTTNFGLFDISIRLICLMEIFRNRQIICVRKKPTAGYKNPAENSYTRNQSSIPFCCHIAFLEFSSRMFAKTDWRN